MGFRIYLLNYRSLYSDSNHVQLNGDFSVTHFPDPPGPPTAQAAWDDLLVCIYTAGDLSELVGE